MRIEVDTGLDNTTTSLFSNAILVPFTLVRVITALVAPGTSVITKDSQEPLLFAETILTCPLEST